MMRGGAGTGLLSLSHMSCLPVSVTPSCQVDGGGRELISITHMAVKDCLCFTVLGPLFNVDLSPPLCLCKSSPLLSSHSS